MTTLTLVKMNERSPPSHGRGEGASQEKTRCNHTSPNAHKENTLNTSFSGREWRKYILPLQSPEIFLLRETSKRKRKLPTMFLFNGENLPLCEILN
jgi:hypothetical protein